MIKEKIEKKKRSFLKTFFIAVIAFVAICVFLLIASGSLSDSDSESNNSASPSSDVTAEAPDSNTSAMVDYIAREAKKSANQSASEEKRDEALDFISSTYPDYFSDNDTMEKSIYYGYYLEYAYSKNGPANTYANLGMDLYQAVKYVYRNTETVEDTHVQENLSQIKEALSELGYALD